MHFMLMLRCHSTVNYNWPANVSIIVARVTQSLQQTQPWHVHYYYFVSFHITIKTRTHIHNHKHRHEISVQSSWQRRWRVLTVSLWTDSTSCAWPCGMHESCFWNQTQKVLSVRQWCRQHGHKNIHTATDTTSFTTLHHHQQYVSSYKHIYFRICVHVRDT